MNFETFIDNISEKLNNIGTKKQYNQLNETTSGLSKQSQKQSTKINIGNISNIKKIIS